MEQNEVTEDGGAIRKLRGAIGKLWLMPLFALLLSFLCGGLAKWVFVLPKGHLLWDASLILLAACIFGTGGFVIGWAVFTSSGDDLCNGKR